MKTVNTLLMIVMLFTSCAERHHYRQARRKQAARVDYQHALLKSIEPKTE